MKLSDFRRENDISTFAVAMEYLKNHQGTALTVEPGTYILTDARARAAQNSVMTGEWGSNPQRAMFNPSYDYTRGISLSGHKGSRILAYGVTLMIDGFMEPISITDCEDIEICGLTIDHLRKPYSKGTVESVSAPDINGFCECIVDLDSECPIESGTPINLRHIFYDTRTDRVIRTDVKCAEYLDSRRIRLTVSRNGDIVCGVEHYMLHTLHSRPAILIEQSKNIRLKDITVHSQPGMGIVGNRSEDITLSGVSVGLRQVIIGLRIPMPHISLQ